MKHLLFLLLVTAYACSMEQPPVHPLLTAIPFDAEGMQIASLAHSMVRGTIRIGTEYCEGKVHPLISFNDFRNDAKTYTISCSQAYDAIRYIIGIGLKQSIANIEKNIKKRSKEIEGVSYSIKVAESLIFTGWLVELKETEKKKLSALKIGEFLPELPSGSRLEVPAHIDDTDSSTEKAAKAKRIIKYLEQYKREPFLLRNLIFIDFGSFYNGDDLKTEVGTDQLQLDTLKVNRAALFGALETGNLEKLCTFGNKFARGKKPITKGRIPSIYEKIDQAISDYRTHLILE